MVTVALSAAWVRSCLAFDNLQFQRISSTESGFDMLALQTNTCNGSLQIFYTRSLAYPEDPAAPTNIFVHGKQFRDGVTWRHESGAPKLLPRPRSQGPELLARRGLLFGSNVIERAGGVTHTWSTSGFVEIRFWMIVLPMTGMSSLLFWRLVRRWSIFRRLRGGLCVKCGYDLRATPDRCPECGAAA